ncbi:MAG: hypothetical protein OXM62_01760, partial [bacterium]|nr:hypothetical protein [bacterium]
MIAVFMIVGAFLDDAGRDLPEPNPLLHSLPDSVDWENYERSRTQIERVDDPFAKARAEYRERIAQREFDALPEPIQRLRRLQEREEARRLRDVSDSLAVSEREREQTKGGRSGIMDIRPEVLPGTFVPSLGDPVDSVATAADPAFFYRDSHEDDVVRVQGTPTKIQGWSTLGYEVWHYGRNTVTISTATRRVTEWSNPTGTLKVRMTQGPNVSESEFFTRGSHEDDVVRVQGTPAKIQGWSTLGYEVWHYGRNTVTISTATRRVTEW